jgi:hypothetical protein
MPRRKSRRSWLYFKPMSSYNFGTENLSANSLNIKRKNSTASAYTYNEHSFSNYQYDTQKDLNFFMFIQNMSYTINISNQKIKINQNSFSKILHFLKKPLNKVFDLIKVNYSNNNRKIELQKNSLINNFNFYQVKINKNGAKIELYKNSLIDIIKKINDSNFKIGKFLDIIINLKKSDFNTRFHNLLSNNSNNFKIKNLPLKKSLSLNYNQILYENFNKENEIEDEKENQQETFNENEKVLEKFLKKENIEKKKVNEELKKEIKPDSLSKNIPNVGINLNNINIKKDKSFISQDDLNELRKNCLGEAIKIRRIIYKIEKKKIKKK